MIRRAFTLAGVVSLLLVIVSLVMLGVAASRGVHCPYCDRERLGDSFQGWARFFQVKDCLLMLGGVGGLAAAAVASVRLWGVIAFGLAILAVLLSPK
jgi:hypothetical protein